MMTTNANFVSNQIKIPLELILIQHQWTEDGDCCITMSSHLDAFVPSSTPSKRLRMIRPRIMMMIIITATVDLHQLYLHATAHPTMVTTVSLVPSDTGSPAVMNSNRWKPNNF